MGEGLASITRETGEQLPLHTNAHTHTYLLLLLLQLDYVLDRNRPGSEIIVKEGQVCLIREEFWSLGLLRDMDSHVSSLFFYYNFFLLKTLTYQSIYCRLETPA